jgi:hypothetical protein
MSGVSTQTGTEHNSRRFSITVAALGLLLGAIAFSGANKAILGLFHDDGIYAVVGKAVAQGDGYRIVSLPSEPPQTKYPFVYPYLLASLWALDPSFPQNIALLKGLNVAIFVAIFYVAAIYYRRCVSGSNGTAVLFAVLLCCNPIIFGFTDYVLSDLWLVLLSLCALTLCAGAVADRARFSRLLLLAGVIGLACLSRSAALPLVFAGVIHTFTLRGWRAAAYFLLGVSLLVAPWLAPGCGIIPSHRRTLLFATATATMRRAGAGEWAATIHRHFSIALGNARYLANMF